MLTLVNILFVIGFFLVIWEIVKQPLQALVLSKLYTFSWKHTKDIYGTSRTDEKYTLGYDIPFLPKEVVIPCNQDLLN